VRDGGVDLPPDQLQLDLGPLLIRRQEGEGQAPGVTTGFFEHR
jgi:hypothetical protein